MVRFVVVVLAVAMSSVVLSKPLEDTNKDLEKKGHHLWKRFINPALASGFFNDNRLSKIRTKRNTAEDCEKLELCKLHARSSRNFLAAFELYFVNKENARLWDHQTHTPADCARRFAHCYAAPARPAPPPPPAPRPGQAQLAQSYRPYDNYRDFRSEDYDYNY